MGNQRSRFNSRRRAAPDLLPGDLVLVRRRPRTQGLSKKFLPKFIGPYQVRRRLGPVTYLVEDVPARRRKRVWRSFPAHVSQIRAFRVPQIALRQRRPIYSNVRPLGAPEEGEGYADAIQAVTEAFENDVVPPVELPVRADAPGRPRRTQRVPAHLRDFVLEDTDE